jgi:hypothetical protein
LDTKPSLQMIGFFYHTQQQRSPSILRIGISFRRHCKKPHWTKLSSSLSCDDPKNLKGTKQEQQQDADIKPSFSVIQKALTIISETSGEKEISYLKQQVNDISQEFDKVTQQVTFIRMQTSKLQSKYEDLQKEHLQLMMRRDSWSEVDIQRFADITGSEVHTKRELDHSRIQLKQFEDLQEKTKKEYMDAVRKRYHEEQLWQDKWRVISTYGTWILIGINSIVFIGGQMLHQRREGERIRILSNLIDDKLSRIMVSADAHDVKGENDDDEKHDTTSTHHDNNTIHQEADTKGDVLEKEQSAVHGIPLESSDDNVEHYEKNDDSCMLHDTKYTIMNYNWIRNLVIHTKSLVHDTVQHLHTPSMILGAVTAVAMMTLRSGSASSGR